jgi:uncharacterized damage-inducible protein DinB
MNTLPTLFDHLVWADERAREAIESIGAERPERSEATRLYAHLAAAEHLWLTRLEGRPAEHAVWPDLSLEAAAALAVESHAGLKAIAAGDASALTRTVDYRTSAGEDFSNTVADILTHVSMHGSYHRGQIALLARQGGGVPVMTDYIVYMRTVAASDAHPA